MSEMNLQESRERCDESLKRASSCARELSRMQKFPLWAQIAISIDDIRKKCNILCQAKSMSKGDIENQITQYQANRTKTQ